MYSIAIRIVSCGQNRDMYHIVTGVYRYTPKMDISKLGDLSWQEMLQKQTK